MKRKLKTGDKVKIISGKDIGKSGKIVQVFPEDDKVVVENCNMRVKHMRARNKEEKGQKISFAAPLDISNVMLVCPKCNKSTRIGYKFLDSLEKTKDKSSTTNSAKSSAKFSTKFRARKRKIRVCKKCGEQV